MGIVLALPNTKIKFLKDMDLNETADNPTISKLTSSSSDVTIILAKSVFRKYPFSFQMKTRHASH